MEDKTADISSLVFIENEVAITFEKTNRTYNYKMANVQVIDQPKIIKIEHVIICVNDFPIGEYDKVLEFGDYIKVFNNQQRVATYEKSKVTFQQSCLNSKQPKAIFEYLKDLSAYVSVLADGKKVLLNQYEKLAKVSEQSVLATYLSEGPIHKAKNVNTPIFPFGFNLSQREAVKKALENSISIIEGPPGTGKTQTILNIIANVVCMGKSVGIVSANNSATSNVQEKLVNNGYGFITALLGNADLKKEFIENKQYDVPELDDWAQEPKALNALSEQLKTINTQLTLLLEDRNRMAKLQEELSKFIVEQAYYENSLKRESLRPSKFSIFWNWSNDSILGFINDLERIADEGNNYSASSKALLFFKYGVYKFKFVNGNQEYIVSSFRSAYYENGIKQRKKAISSIKANLKDESYEELMEQYTILSSELFKASLYRTFSKRIRANYSIKSYKYNFQDFIQDYPVILSTTHSIKTSITDNYLFDYLIIDEASQVDLVTASLALSCCKNVVIVGDTKQLPQIVPTEIAMRSDEILSAYNIGESYDYSKFSIIASLMNIYKDDLPKTLLCEHYRCHPKIIGFCNEKFYDNQLVVMTEEFAEDKPLRLYRTAQGNHARRDNFSDGKGWYNIRQIEVVRDEIINKYQAVTSIGIISPYRKHVTETKQLIPHPDLEVDTVHKFQGLEKHTIVFTTVANDINRFIDDANLINVAVSRAVKELIVVTSNKLFKQHGTNIGDLIRYIEYNSMEGDIIESPKISVFDLLYSESSAKLLKFMSSAKHMSKYTSENLMYSVIEEVIALPEFSSFKCVMHIPLNSIVRDLTSLKDEERNYTMNPWTHVDFLIFNKLDKEPVLVVEVDGHKFHRDNEQQRHRDALKDKILAQIDLPILRIATNESGEREKLIKKLNEIVKLSAETSEGVIAYI
ncbi:MAG: AAA domain-containing protein [Paenibacillaceae bacterium]